MRIIFVIFKYELFKLVIEKVLVFKLFWKEILISNINYFKNNYPWISLRNNEIYKFELIIVLFKV